MRNNARKNKNKFSLAQKLVIVIIGICFLIVILFLIFCLVNKPETRIKNTIDNLARDYYENYLYADFSTTSDFQNDPAAVMSRYEEYGFSSIPLRQLLLYDGKKNAEFAAELKKYCDENNTLIKFFPEPPYGDRNYRINYTYTCEF